MKFKFSYGKLLEHYHLQEQIARRDYNESLSKLEVEKKLHAKMWEDLDQATDDLFQSRSVSDSGPSFGSSAGSASSTGGMSMARLEQLTVFIDGQKVRIARQREVVMNYTTIVEQKQEILIAAAKETKTLEKLKEKQLIAFKKMQKKHEAKVTDELVVTRFHPVGDDS